MLAGGIAATKSKNDSSTHTPRQWMHRKGCENRRRKLRVNRLHSVDETVCLGRLVRIFACARIQRKIQLHVKLCFDIILLFLLNFSFLFSILHTYACDSLSTVFWGWLSCFVSVLCSFTLLFIFFDGRYTFNNDDAFTSVFCFLFLCHIRYFPTNIALRYPRYEYLFFIVSSVLSSTTIFLLCTRQSLMGSLAIFAIEGEMRSSSFFMTYTRTSLSLPFNTFSFRIFYFP